MWIGIMDTSVPFQSRHVKNRHRLAISVTFLVPNTEFWNVRVEQDICLNVIVQSYYIFMCNTIQGTCYRLFNKRASHFYCLKRVLTKYCNKTERFYIYRYVINETAMRKYVCYFRLTDSPPAD